MMLIVSIVILKDKLSVVRDKCLAEHYVIASSLIGDMQALEQRGNNVEENIDSLMRLYSRYLQGKGNGLAVAFSGKWIIDNFSHELRIPLTAIYGYAEYIQKALMSEEERYECTQFIMSECSRLQNMAYQLLDMALLGRDERKASDCSVKELFLQSEKAMQMRAAEKRIKLIYALSQNLTVSGNMEQLLILTNNLIENAIKASRAAGGAGLGLAICERIIQIHHAEMSFVSEPGIGTTVKLSFPVQQKNNFTSQQ